MSQQFSDKPRTFAYQQNPFQGQPLQLNGRLIKYNNGVQNQTANNDGAWDNFMSRTYQNECTRQPNLNNYGDNSRQNIFPEEIQKKPLNQEEQQTNQGSMVDFLNKTGEYNKYFERRQQNSKKNEETQEKVIKRYTKGIALKNNDYYSQIESLGYPETYIRPATNDLSVKTVIKPLSTFNFKQLDQLPGAANYQHNLAISVAKNAREIINPQESQKQRCCTQSQNSSDEYNQFNRCCNDKQKESQKIANIDTNYKRVKQMNEKQQFLAQSDQQDYETVSDIECKSEGKIKAKLQKLI